jgi:TIR domain
MLMATVLAVMIGSHAWASCYAGSVLENHSSGFMADPGEVFASYSWDSEEHTKAVLALSNRLRGDGIDCVLDQYEVSPPEGWPRWMDRKIASAGLVLVVCTEIYLAKINGEDAPDKGLGVKWEGGLIYQHLYNQGASNSRFIPVLMKASDKRFIPVPLQGASYFVVDTEVGYQHLYNRLLGRPAAEKPPLGKPVPMPRKAVKTDPTLYFSSPVNVPLWDKARWVATAFLWAPGQIPILALAFLNKEPAETIFKEWRQRYGEQDMYEELRVAVVEGDIPGKAPGYSVHISVNWENLLERYKRAGFTPTDDDHYMTVSRIHRMNPQPGATNLASFKNAYKEFGSYLLAPAVCKRDGSNLNVNFDLMIAKRDLFLRKAEDIGPDDADRAVFIGSKKGED